MRIEILSGWDGMTYPIDTLSAELLARWLVETFGRIRPTAAAPAMVRIWPSMTPDGGADWIADNRVLGVSIAALTPREVLDAMASQVAELERLHARTD